MKVVSSLCSSVDPDRRINILCAACRGIINSFIASVMVSGHWCEFICRMVSLRIDLLGEGTMPAPPELSDCVCSWQRYDFVAKETAHACGQRGGIRYDKRKTNTNEITENHPRTKWALEKCFEYLSCRCGSAGKCLYRTWTFICLYHSLHLKKILIYSCK